MLHPKRLSAKDRPRERGVVIIYTAFFMLFLLGFVAIGIDVSKLMATRTQLQRAADAAALAGASAIDFETGSLIPDTCVIRAQETAALNKAFVKGDNPISLLAGDISFPTPTRIKVKVRRDASAGGSMVTHIAQVLGISSLDVSATATAEAAPANEVCERLVPLAAIPPTGSTEFQPGCANSVQLFAGQGGGSSGNWQGLIFPSCTEGPCAGQPSTGANTMRCLVGNGYSCCVGIGNVVQTQPGAMAGPMVQALQQRFDADTDRRSGICYSEYTGNGSRIVNVPIVDPLLPGRSTTTVRGFTAFFMSARPTGVLQPLRAEFLYNMAPGSSNGSAPPGTTYTIRLVE